MKNVLYSAAFTLVVIAIAARFKPVAKIVFNAPA